jgi:hypothetical protein
MKILAIDPANSDSAWCLIDTDTYKPISFNKCSNDIVLDVIVLSDFNMIVIEGVACYGMAVGKEVFETCVWIGRFMQMALPYVPIVNIVYRKDVKLNLCGSMKAKDGNIRQALIDRFGVVGTKKEQGWFYGFHSDIWSAYAVGVTYLDTIKAKNKL